MPSYNFTKEAEVYVVYSGNKHKLDISSISFSQTFAQNSYEVKTLHNQKNLFAGSVINKANPANFEFTFPALKDGDFSTIFNLLVDYQGTTNKLRTFDLYISTKLDVFKVETAVLTNGSFVIERSRPLSIAIQGEAAKVSRIGSASSYTIPGSAQSRTNTRTYIASPAIEAIIAYGGFNTTLTNIVGVSIELQNEGKWNAYRTLHSALSATTASSSMYPSSFSLQKRTLAGSISQFLTDKNTALLQQWDTAATLTLKAGNGTGASFRGFSFGPTTCSFTNRVGVGSTFVQNIDWRLVTNPANLSSILKYITD